MKKLMPILFLLFLFSCGSDKSSSSIPGNILTKDKMAEVMLDVQLMEATFGTSLLKTEFEPMPPPSTNIIKKHGITKAQYDESFEYYSQHPELFSEVYQIILNNLSKMQAEVTSQK